jgi:deazaflavin-dependent oxidoreductase (nitroreductase family)
MAMQTTSALPEIQPWLQWTTPLGYVREGDGYVIMASKSGAPTNPAWYHNRLAHPTATVEVGDEHFPVKPTVIEGEQRDRLWERMVAQLGCTARR